MKKICFILLNVLSLALLVLSIIFKSPMKYIAIGVYAIFWAFYIVILIRLKKIKTLYTISIVITLLCLTINLILPIEKENVKEIKQKFYYVVHAGGGVEETQSTYLNAKEPFEIFLQNGYKYIEIDFCLSSDNEVICTHYFDHIDNDFSFSNKPTKQKFENSLILGQYHPITFNYLLDKLIEYPDVKIIFDTKDNSNLNELIEKMCADSEARNFDIKNRFIIQVYSLSNYENLQSFGFEEYWFTNYKVNYSMYQINYYFNDKENITCYVLAINNYLNFSQQGFGTEKDIAVHTVNDPSTIDELKNKGVEYIFIDYLR